MSKSHKQTTTTPTHHDMSEILQRLAKLEQENQNLKQQVASAQSSITFKVSQKKAISVYGLNRLPTTLYAAQWKAILDKKDELLQFIKDHEHELATKDKKPSKSSCDSDSETDSDSDDE